MLNQETRMFYEDLEEQGRKEVAALGWSVNAATLEKPKKRRQKKPKKYEEVCSVH
jgi:hypothetical protein